MTSPSRPTDDPAYLADWGCEHGKAVRSYLLAMLRRSDLADDLTQEVFCRAWQARGRYRERGTARAYLLRIADRLVCDQSRRKGREVTLAEESWQRMEPASPALEPSQALVQAEAIRQLGAALDSLSPAQRRVLLLRYYGQCGFAEIAEIMECPLGTVLSHCHRGLSVLRKLLVEHAE
jgi:RNA polymerase sigma-70 factor (ECF subfamily)